MNVSRRNILQGGLFGAGGAGLRALATGLPVAVFARSLEAAAQEVVCVDKARAQYLILSTSAGGDPLNANVPGTYDHPAIAHAADPRMAATPITLGTQTVTGAQLWSTLPGWALGRTCFFHHATLTNNHGNLPKVMSLMGATARQEMLPSIAARHLAPCLGTIQNEPVSAGAGTFLTYQGRGLPNLPPTGLRDVLTRPKGPLANLQSLRDKTIDQVYLRAKAVGTPAQRAFIDELAMSRRQARSLSDDLVGMLAGIKGNDGDAQILAAVALIRMNVTPVVAIRFDFGGDNHSDPDLLKSEVPQTEAGVRRIGALLELLKQFGIEDKVTFVAQNVFGRTLAKKGLTGRDHWASHHCSVIIGKGMRGGVVGGLEPKAGDFYATPIDSKTGRGVPGGGDIPFDETLGAVGKTIASALGLDAALIDAQIRPGKIVTAALT